MNTHTHTQTNNIPGTGRSDGAVDYWTEVTSVIWNDTPRTV